MDILILFLYPLFFGLVKSISTRELVSTVRLPAEAEAFVTSTIAAGKKRRTLSNAQVNFYTLASSCLNQF